MNTLKHAICFFVLFLALATISRSREIRDASSAGSQPTIRNSNGDHTFVQAFKNAGRKMLNFGGFLHKPPIFGFPGHDNNGGRRNHTDRFPWFPGHGHRGDHFRFPLLDQLHPHDSGAGLAFGDHRG